MSISADHESAAALAEAVTLHRHRYIAPDFSARQLMGAPPARTVPAEADGVLADGFFSTTNLPTYIKGANGEWTMPREPRMDGCLVHDGTTGFKVVEPRRVKRGEPVVTARAEDGTEGVLVHGHGFVGDAHVKGDFQFMSSQVSREKPIDYRVIAGMLLEERRRGGRVIWVAGPAVVHSRARDNFAWFVRNGFVQAVLAGNAVAVHDVEAAIVGTTLGMNAAGEPTEGGHSAHVRAINAVRRAGSIANGVRSGLIRSGIMHACVEMGVPYVLCGSIRDDGPLPEVITDSIEAQDVMRRFTSTATMSIMIATALHSIAVGNMLPAYYDDADRGILELPTICVDMSEFLVNKVKDRGTQQAMGVVSNAQDFMSILRTTVEAASAA
jgi:lysine-ketoglutarate reductase/saccharopine dehydrogenase-like protein (TIGR00300 family)